MQKQRLFFGVTAVTGALLLAGCGPSEDIGSSTPLQSAPTESEAAPDQPGSQSIDATKAVEIALEAVPGTVVDLELDREGTALVWEVGVLGTDGTGVEVNIDSATGEVSGQREFRLSSAQHSAPGKTIDAAIEIALGAVGGAVTEAELDSEDGRVVWEVTVFDDPVEWDLDIDATTGEVVKKKQDG